MSVVQKLHEEDVRGERCMNHPEGARCCYLHGTLVERTVRKPYTRGLTEPSRRQPV